MGKILIPGSGSGADLDVITADASDVLAPKVIVGRDGEPVAGTLALSGNASPADVRSGRTYYGMDARTRMTGTMAEKGAAAYTPGSYNQVIGAGQYLAGEQTILGDGNLASQYIKKGVTIFGVTGSWEGYVPMPTDLYLRGNNIAGFYNTGNPKSVIFQSGMIEIISSASGGDYNVTGYVNLIMGTAYNFAGYSKLNLEFRVLQSYIGGSAGQYYFNVSLYNGTYFLLSEKKGPYDGSQVYTTFLDISGFSTTAALMIKIGAVHRFYLYRIWLE